MALSRIIPSYLYTDFNDDDALQAFVKSFNDMAQAYLDDLNALNLSIYTKDPVSGLLLDWVALGLYGMDRPVLPTVGSEDVGPFNTAAFGEIALDEYIGANPGDNVYYTTDDLFRRILTWHFFKGDGQRFNIRWLKRRIARFLFGIDGINFNVDQTYRISVVFGADNEVTIRIINSTLTVTGGAFFGDMGFNEDAFDDIDGFVTTFPIIPEASILEQAMASGALETPFQYTFVVTQGGFAEYAI